MAPDFTSNYSQACNYIVDELQHSLDSYLALTNKVSTSVNLRQVGGANIADCVDIVVNPHFSEFAFSLRLSSQKTFGSTLLFPFRSGLRRP